MANLEFYVFLCLYLTLISCNETMFKIMSFIDRRNGTVGTLKNFVYFVNFIPRECKDDFSFPVGKDTRGRRAFLSFFFPLLVILSR